MNEERAQATIEAIAAIPILLLAGAISLQLLLAGYALTLADGAAEAAALAQAAARPAKVAAREALPEWAVEEAEVSVLGGEVTVRLHPPSLLPGLEEHLSVSGTAFARPARR